MATISVITCPFCGTPNHFSPPDTPIVFSDVRCIHCGELLPIDSLNLVLTDEDKGNTRGV